MVGTHKYSFLRQAISKKLIFYIAAVNEHAVHSPATYSAQRRIGTVTMSVSRTTEYVTAIKFTIDAEGTQATSLCVVAMIELIYYGYLTAPSITEP